MRFNIKLRTWKNYTSHWTQFKLCVKHGGLRNDLGFRKKLKYLYLSPFDRIVNIQHRSVAFLKEKTKSEHSYQFVWIMLYDPYGSYHVVWIPPYFIACYSWIRFFSLLNLFHCMFTSGKMEIKICILIS